MKKKKKKKKKNNTFYIYFYFYLFIYNYLKTKKMWGVKLRIKFLFISHVPKCNTPTAV